MHQALIMIPTYGHAQFHCPGHPNDPVWEEYLRLSNQWCLDHGGRMALGQVMPSLLHLSGYMANIGVSLIPC